MDQASKDWGVEPSSGSVRNDGDAADMGMAAFGLRKSGCRGALMHQNADDFGANRCHSPVSERAGTH